MPRTAISAMRQHKQYDESMNFFSKKSRELDKKIVLVVVLIFVGIFTIIVSRAATPTASIQPENGVKSGNYTLSPNASASGGSSVRFGGSTVSCGKRVQNYSYQVPFGNAVWNQPVCNLPLHPKSANYASRFYNYANGLNVTPAPGGYGKGNLGVKFGLDPDPYKSFGRNVFYASDSTQEKAIWANNGTSNLDGDDVPQTDYRRFTPNRKIPWNPDWKTGLGGDNEIVILEDRNSPPAGLAPKGSLYEISGYRPPDQATLLCGLFLNPYNLQTYPGRLCSYNVNILRNADTGAIADYRTYEGSSDSRGGGISMYATLTTPEEVDAGEIRHALGLGLFNTAFGPACSTAQLNTAAEGETCGTAIAPASKFEWGSGPRSGDAANLLVNQTIPEGMRFRLKAPQAEIENWISSQGFSAAKERTARIFIRALQDYGAIIVDTGGVSQIQVAAGYNPEARALWAKNGIVDDSDKRFLFGLFNETSMEVIAPPTNNCITGVASKYFCKYLTSKYGN
ncbi:MAG: hypothetical protein QG628_171 [Patescibacteria group bacterium]|jgi:hypothetical protein|nr:hypothetical protein [Patescibacteria group bacterium]